ncbi:DUF7146 domain-containing protein [Tateyamaria sp.]|uniref:DUF7146 domain-containing protein n=1 Tax=Tateyamaria sp. TaxID=1929288 RepID=UPI003B218EFA
MTEPRATRRRAREDAAQDANDRATLILTLRGLVRPLAGSPAAAYLASRGITRLPDNGLEDLPRLDADLPDPLRHRIYGPDHPALLVWVTDAQGVVTVYFPSNWVFPGACPFSWSFSPLTAVSATK